MESVEDEWERQLESDKDLDLLFVAFHPERIEVAAIQRTIEEHGFEAVVTDEE